MRIAGVRKPRKRMALGQWYSLLVVVTVLYVVAIFSRHYSTLHRFSMRSVTFGKPELRTSNISASYLPANGSVPQQDIILAILRASLELDQSMLNKQKLMVSNPKSFLILHTSSWSLRVATMIAYWGSILVRRQGFMHIVYHGSDISEVEELRFAGGASYSAVHMFDWKLMNKFFDFNFCSNDRDCAPEDRTGRQFKYLAEVALLGVGLESHASHITHAWILDDNVEYIGDFSEFLERSDSIEADVLVAKALSRSPADERVENGTVVTTYGGIRRISGPMFQKIKKKIVSELGIVSDDIVYSNACAQDPLCTVKWLNVEMPGALDYAVFEQFELNSELPFLKCLHSHLGNLFINCNKQESMNITTSSLNECDNMYGKFISRRTKLKLEETILFEFQFARKCELQPVQTYHAPRMRSWAVFKSGEMPSYDTLRSRNGSTVALKLSDKVKIPAQLVHRLKSPQDVYHGRKGSWWVEVGRRAGEGFTDWDGEMIAKQFRVNPKPKVIYTVRTHKVDERVMMNLSRQAMSVARYGGHMHVIYQGYDLMDFHMLRSLLQGYMVAAHWFNPSAVQWFLTRKKRFWNFFLEVCLVKHARPDLELGGCFPKYRKWVDKGGYIRKTPAKLMWLYAYLPEVFFLGKFGPIPDNSTYWNTEYDVSFAGDIASMFEVVRLSADDDLVAPGDGEDDFGPFRVDMAEWAWWVFAGSWTKLEDEYRLLSSTKRLSGNFAARVVEATFVNGWLAADEIFLGTLCTATPGCRIRHMNDNFDFHSIKFYQPSHLFQDGEFRHTRLGFNALSDVALRGMLVHKVSFPFSVCENINLRMSYVVRDLAQDSDWCKPEISQGLESE